MSLEKEILNYLAQKEKDGGGAKSTLTTLIRQAKEANDKKYLNALLKVKEKIKGSDQYSYKANVKTPIKERPSKNTIGRKLKAQRDYAEDSKNIPLIQKLAIEKSGVLPKYVTNYKKKKGGMVQKKYVNPVKIVDNRKRK